MKRRITRVLSLGMAAFLVTGALYMPVFASEEGQEEVAVTVVDEAASSEEENTAEDEYVEESQTAEENVQEEVQENEGQEETIPAYSDGDAVEEVEGETSDQDTQVSSETNENTVEVVEENTEEQTAQLSEEVNDSAESAVDETAAEATENSGQKSSDVDTAAVSVPVLPASESVPAEVTIVEPGTTEEIPGVDPANARKKGWYKEGSWWYYADSNGKDVTGWKKIDGKWYYFTPEMMTGEVGINRKSYFFRDDGSLFTGTGWYKDTHGYWYYLSNGKRVEGWKKISGKWYYFDYDMATGERYIDGSDYRFRDSGSMITGWYKYVWGDGYVDWYYYLPSGKKASGWQKIGGKWYYFDGSMVTGEEAIDGSYYRFRDNGSMVTGWYKYDGGDDYIRWYYYLPSGKKASGWQKIGGKWYYFDGSMVTGEEAINGSYYRFRDSGSMVTGWYKDADGLWFYYLPNGKEVTGWRKISGKWYYFRNDMACDDMLIIKGKGYKFSSNGALMYTNTTGWIKKLDGNGNVRAWSYATGGGALAYEWQKINGKWYYFDYNCELEKYSGVREIDGDSYLFGNDGALLGAGGGWAKGDYTWYYANKGGSLVKGWKKIDGKWYYFDANGGYDMYYSGTYTINQKEYTFDENGVWTGQ